MGFPLEADFAGLLARLARALSGHDLPFMLIGGQAVLLHGEPRRRARDLEDARGVIRRKGRELDWSYLRAWAERFAAIPGREQMP